MHAQVLIFHCADELSYFGTIKYYTKPGIYSSSVKYEKKDNKRHKKIIKDEEIQLNTKKCNKRQKKSIKDH